MLNDCMQSKSSAAPDSSTVESYEKAIVVAESHNCACPILDKRHKNNNYDEW